MYEYEIEWVSEGISMEHVQEFVNRLNSIAEKEKDAFQLLESARKIYDSIQNDMTLKIYENALDWYMYWADRADDVIAEIESEGGIVT